MKTHAETIADAARESVAANFDGTAIIMRDGTRVIPGNVGARKIAEVRKSGRCTMARYAYADGSKLLFRWDAANGARITTGARK